MNRLIKIARNNVFQQILFWALSFFVLFRLFTINYSNGLSDVLYTILFHLPLVLVVYLNYSAIKLLLNEKKYTLYALMFLGILGIGVVAHYLVLDILSDWILPGFYFVSYYSVFEVIQFILAYLIVSLLWRLSKNWFVLQQKQRKLEKENHAAKLGMLKAQINPHFLFNSLNNIYSLSTPENMQAKSYLLKLSDALRYMIYETEEAFVPLEKDLEYLRNYIDLEKLRLESNANISFEVSGNVRRHIVAPLLILPIVENCFKHCDKDDPYINIEISSQENGFLVKTKNNIGKKNQKMQGGVGLANVRKRLKLIYPNNHVFNAMVRGDYFITELNIKTKN